MKIASKRAEHVVAVGRDRDAGLEEVVGAPRQVLELERPAEHFADTRQHFHRFGGDFLADAVARDDCDLGSWRLGVGS